MRDPKKLFHAISYLQYPLMLIGLYYCYRPLLSQLNNIWGDFNFALVFMGLGISFSTLQDTTKTQNKLSKRVFENEKYSKRFLIFLFIQILLFNALGLCGLFMQESSHLKELSFGLLSLGAGTIGVLKSAVEMASNHRKTETTDLPA
jgi:hypothetical protein